MKINAKAQTLETVEDCVKRAFAEGTKGFVGEMAKTGVSVVVQDGEGLRKQQALAAVKPSEHEASALSRLTALLGDAKNLFSESVEPEAKQHAADIGMCAQWDVDVLAWLRNADEVLAAVKGETP